VAGRYALIVATDAYADEKLCRLRAPAHDADALAKVLRDPDIGDFEVTLLANEPESVLRRRIASFFGERARDDLLLLHFSCHGLKDDSGQLYFAAADTEVDHLDASAVSAEFVSRQMARSRSNSVLMLLDCCYSGAIARGLTFRAGDTVDVNDHLGGRGRAIITASSAMEYAFEGDDLSGQGQPSVFTSAVVKALRTGEADRDQDRWISVRELYDYVCVEVREATPNQRPNMLSHLEGELYIARSRYVVPVSLPVEVLEALDNPLPQVRAAAVGALVELMRADPRLAVAARERLEAVAGGDDSRRVAAAAESALGRPAPEELAAPPEQPPTEAGLATSRPAATPAASPPAATSSGSPRAPRARRAITGDGARIVAAVSSAVLTLSWFIPWYNGYAVPQLSQNYSNSRGLEAVIQRSWLAAAVVALALTLAGRRRTWPALAAIAGWALGGIVVSTLYSHNCRLDAGAYLALAALVALVPAAVVLAGRTPQLLARTPVAEAIAAAGGVLTAVLLELRDHAGDTTIAALHVVALLSLAAAAVAGARIAGRARDRVLTGAMIAVGGTAMGLAATYHAGLGTIAAAALTAAGAYSAFTR
jgi:Caspase domain